jgi:hypothetical protein
MLSAVAAIVGIQPVSAKDAPKAGKDPNEKICEKQKIIGSRLTTRRVCATRAEWEEQRRMDRDAVEKAQMQVGIIKI